MTEASPARFAFVLGAMGALLAGCAQPNPDTAAADAMRPRKFRFATDSALEQARFEPPVPLPQTTPSTSPCRALHPTPGFSPAERGAARFGGGDGSEDLVWAAHRGRGLTMQYSFRHRMRPTELRKD
jgi:hypothetical protein